MFYLAEFGRIISGSLERKYTVLKWGRNIIYSYPILIQVARREGRGIFWWKGTKEVISTTCKVLVAM